MKLRAHHNVINIDERSRAEHESAVSVTFPGFKTAPASQSHPAAQSLLARLLQRIGARHSDEQMRQAGESLERKVRGDER
jgi:hypothetical protein